MEPCLYCGIGLFSCLAEVCFNELTYLRSIDLLMDVKAWTLAAYVDAS